MKHTDSEDSEPQGPDMETDQNACPDCGALYSTRDDVNKHMETCGEPESSDKDSEDENEEDESAWVVLVQEVYDMHDDEYQAKVAESGEQDENAAAKVADKAMRPTYLKTLRRLFKKRLAFALKIQKSKHYELFEDQIEHLMDDKGYSLEKAVATVVNKNRKVFEEVMSEGEDSSSDSDA